MTQLTIVISWAVCTAPLIIQSFNHFFRSGGFSQPGGVNTSVSPPSAHFSIPLPDFSSWSCSRSASSTNLALSQLEFTPYNPAWIYPTSTKESRFELSTVWDTQFLSPSCAGQLISLGQQRPFLCCPLICSGTITSIGGEKSSR